MKLISLRISGFKSFLDPTEIQIKEGLTGIVGPNGCGKSNIVEAIKWVMGETSAKLVRGDGMDDVIFSGTNDRPARNFAEVTIKLDNSEKKAPANFNQFDEIEITRTIEREKGSTYRINNKQVRARDVQLIFADTGTGARSTGIVSQGRIAQIIDASAEDRRVILEEAANIKGLHNRRHEAELKLSGASENLNRLFDIEQTYKEQLSELEKQGRKAARYRSIGDRIRKAEASLFLNLLKSAEKEADALKIQLITSEDNVNASQIEASKYTELKIKILNTIPDLKKIEKEKAIILQKLNIDKIRIEEEKSSIKKNLENTTNQINQIKNDIDREFRIKEDASKTLLNLDLDKKKLHEENKKNSSKFKKSSNLVIKLKKQSKAAEENLSSITSKILSLNTGKKKLENKVLTLKEKIETSKKQISEIYKNEDKKILQTNKKKIEDKKNILLGKKKIFEVKKNLLNKIEILKLDLSNQKNNISLELNQLNAELNSLLSLLGNNFLIKNSFEKSITYDTKLQKAIGSVLGESLLAPIISSNKAKKDASYWRYDFTTSVSSKLPEGTTPLISESKKLSIFDRALVGIGLVKNEEIALSLQKKLTFGQALTTIDGGLWRWDGFVQPLGVRNKYSERLEQITKIKLLQKEIPLVEKNQSKNFKKLNKTILEIEENKTILSELQMEIDNLYEEINLLEIENSKIEAKLQSSSILISDLQNNKKVSENELVILERELVDITNLPSLLAEELKIRNIADQYRNQLTDAIASEQQTKNLENFQSQNLTQINDQIENWKIREKEANSRLNLLKERLKLSQNEKIELSKLPNDFEEQEKILNSKLNEAFEKRNLAADNLALAETNLIEHEKNEREAEKKVGLLREEMIRIDALSNLSITKIKNIEDRIFEKLRINSNELIKFINVDENEIFSKSVETLEKTVQRLLNEREALGNVNLRAEDEMNEMKNKVENLSNEIVDLEQAINKLRSGIFELNREGRERLINSFEKVNDNFKNLFQKLFGGGNAELKLIGNEDPLKASLEVLASPPGKKMQLLSLLSGGEQALTSIAIIFSVFLCNPAPICILDEVDASLDDTNVSRFCDLLDNIESKTKTYFMVVTHHRHTMSKMDRLFGVTMENKGISKLVSVDLEKAIEMRENL